VGGDLDGLAVIGHGLILVLESEQHAASRQIGVEIVGIELDAPCVFVKRALEVLLEFVLPRLK